MFRYGVLVVGLSVLGCGAVQNPDPCAGVVCGSGRCAIVGDAAACLCDVGFVADGLTCTVAPPADLCASNPCVNLTNSLCQQSNGAVRCVCPTSRVEVNGACVVRTACLPNPCQNVHRTTCEVAAGVAACRCDRGYAPEGDGCSAAPVWTCATQHGDGDSAEPDECPPLARALVIDTDENRTLTPAGDHDWFALGLTPGHLFSFSANSATTPLLIEVFDAAGVTLLASDNRGTPQASVAFVAPSQAAVVRVRGVRASDTGAYVVRYSELGVDDYVNTTVGAITLVPGANPFEGEVQYAGDLDVVWLEMPASTAVDFGLKDAGPDLLVEIARPDGGVRTLNSGEFTTLSTNERLSLTAKGRTDRTLGTFALSLVNLGPDDHSDDPAFGTPLAADDIPVSGRFDRRDDADSFIVSQSRDHLYRAQLQPQGSSPAFSVIRASGQVTSPSYGNLALVWKADESRPAAVRVQDTFYSSPGASFTIALEDLGFDDHSDSQFNATPATQGVPVAGRLELSTDIDTFSFTSTPGRIIQVAATQTGMATTVLHVGVYSPQGTLVEEADGRVSALLTASGVYTARVTRGGYVSATDLVAYTMTVSDLGVDDHGGTSASATPLMLGTAITGSVQWGADVDTFAVNVLAGHVYDANCTRASSACSMQVKDALGQVVSNGSSTRFFAATSGRWLIEVNSGSSYSPALGPYTLTVSDLGLEDHGATIATATPVTVGTGVNGAVSFPQDVDVFSFTAVSGHIYAATVTTSGSLRLEARDSANTTLSSTTGSTTSFISPASGSLYVFVSNPFSSYGPYTLTVSDRGLDDHANVITGATQLTLGVGASADIQYQGDLDVFTLTGVAGHHHQATATSPNGNVCSLSVLDANGVQFANGSTVSFKPPAASSTVFLRVSSYADPIRCTVQVSDVGADDHGDTGADATALTLGAPPTSGVLETTVDIDAFSFVAAAGDIIDVHCKTTTGAACGLSVLAPSGLSALQTSTGSQIETGFLATVAGTYVAQVRGTGVASYSLSVSRGADDFTVTTPFTFGTPQTGTIDYVGDSDVFSVSLTAGTVVRPTITTGARASIKAPNGTTVANVYSFSSSTFTPSVTGTYLVTVIGESSSAGALASYTLTVQ